MTQIQIDMTDKSQALTQVVLSEKVEEQTAVVITGAFQEFLNKIEESHEAALAIEVTSLEDADLMKKASDMRKALVKVRTSADKKRKELKADALAYGRAVQSAYAFIEGAIKPIEEHLLAQEKFAENLLLEKQNQLRTRRVAECEQYSEFVPFGMDLGLLEEDEYQKIYNGAKLQFEHAKQEAIKAEQERIAREKAEAEERERVRIENERLRKEAEEREAQIAKERAEAAAKQAEIDAKIAAEKAEAEAKFQAEIEARRKIERELQAKKEAEAKAEAERLKAEAEAKAAPDMAKIEAFVQKLASLEYPEVNDEAAKAIVSDAQKLIAKTIQHINSKMGVTA